MIRISGQDFDKLVNLLKKEGMTGAQLVFTDDTTCLRIKTIDRNNKEVIIELSDVAYPFMPRATRTETF